MCRNFGSCPQGMLRCLDGVQGCHVQQALLPGFLQAGASGPPFCHAHPLLRHQVTPAWHRHGHVDHQLGAGQGPNTKSSADQAHTTCTLVRANLHHEALLLPCCCLQAPCVGASGLKRIIHNGAPLAQEHLPAEHQASQRVAQPITMLPQSTGALLSKQVRSRAAAGAASHSALLTRSQACAGSRACAVRRQPSRPPAGSAAVHTHGPRKAPQGLRAGGTLPLERPLAALSVWEGPIQAGVRPLQGQADGEHVATGGGPAPTALSAGGGAWAAARVSQPQARQPPCSQGPLLTA